MDTLVGSRDVRNSPWLLEGKIISDPLNLCLKSWESLGNTRSRWSQKPGRRELQLTGVISYGWNNTSYTFIFSRRVITPLRTGSGPHLVVLDGIFFCILRILGIDTVPNSFDLKLWYEKSFLPEKFGPSHQNSLFEDSCHTGSYRSIGGSNDA